MARTRRPRSTLLGAIVATLSATLAASCSSGTSTSAPSAPVPEKTVVTTTALTSATLERFAFVSSSAGYGLFERAVGGACDTLVGATSDGGAQFGAPASLATWPCSGSAPLDALAFDDHGDGFAYGPDLVVTHDGGANWADSAQPGAVVSVAALGTSVWMLEAVCPSAAATACPLEVFVSTDGGRTWTPSAAQPTGATGGTGGFGTALVRVSRTSAYVVAPPAPNPTGTPNTVPLWSTDDGGASWTTLGITCGLGAFDAVLSAAPDGTLLAVCAGQPSAGNQAKATSRSTDGGRTWTVALRPCPSASASCPANPVWEGLGYVGELDAVSADTAYLVGPRAALAVTHDGGSVWTSVERIGGQDAGTNQVDFSDPDHGVVLARDVATGEHAVLWHTANAGASWTALHPVATVRATRPTGGVVLRADGLGVVGVGATQAATVAALTRELGRSTGTEPGVCPGRTEVEWHDLAVEFENGVFTGYRDRRIAIAVGSGPGQGAGQDAAASGPVLATATGVTLGTTLARARTLYPPGAFSLEQGGALVVPGARAGDRLFLGFFESDPSALLDEIKGGNPCGNV